MLVPQWTSEINQFSKNLKEKFNLKSGLMLGLKATSSFDKKITWETLFSFCYYSY
jgi:hypothetical protein